MNIHAYTSFTLAYLSRARVLARTLRDHHPDWVLWAVITDRLPEGFDEAALGDFDRVLWTDELFDDLGTPWIFQHNVVEVCTAVKGRAARAILEASDCDQLFYFDPDIAVLSSLDGLSERLSGSSVILTPHQVTPEADDIAVQDNEIASLQYGSFNLGFLGINKSESGRAVVDWWEERLERWCHERLDIGVFVDQKWFNLVPCLFDGVGVVRHPGCNVASWNISQRSIEISDDGRILSNDEPLLFYHFSKIGGAGDLMTQRYAADNPAVFEIWAWYRLAIEELEPAGLPPGWWAYGAFEDGTPVAMEMRRLYRERKDVRDVFPEPFASGPNCLQEWFRQHENELEQYR